MGTGKQGSPRIGGVRGTSGYRVSPWVPYAFLVPAILLFAAFSLYPVLRALTWSFTEMTLLAPDSARWVGVQNYVNAFRDPELFGPPVGTGAFWNTLRFAAWLLPAYIVVPLLLAAMLEKLTKGQVLLRTAIFVPVIISMAVAAVIWVMIYDQNYGIINLGILHVRNGLNAIISCVGVGTGPYFTFNPPNWLGDQRWAMPALAIMSFWNGMGLNVLLYLVGLNRIDTELYEAARVDGAGTVRQFWAITLPMLRPTTYLVLLLSAIGALHVFGQMYIMTQGGPANSTQSYVMYLYKVAFSPMRNCEFGYASALAFILAGAIFTLSALSQRMNRPVEDE
jgi:multiple sugar transport system permease protein